jgi:outer membrane murein-binding lipoprotein Lpp
MNKRGVWAVGWLHLVAVVAVFVTVWWGCWQWGCFMGRAKAAIEYTETFPDLVRDLRAEVATLEAQRDALRQEIALLERERADWQLDNPQLPAAATVSPEEKPNHP